ncbi:MAG: diacylglycerol kinase family protein [Spirochaetes bacterium]|nr:diacylglycerol kinase family protein [Spirochaetota bacterium]
MGNERFIEGIRALAARSPLFASTPLEVILVVNPKAGGFTRRSVRARHLAELAELEAEASALPERSSPFTFRVLTTDRPGHAKDMAKALAAENPGVPGTERLAIMASGDGTSHEFQSGLMECDETTRSRFVMLRLPLGTGNDGSDGRDLRTAGGRLVKPARFGSQRAIRISCAPASAKGPWFSFNIASIGLDAFVTEMTNRLKSSLPGDSYRLWVDFASVFYDLIYKVRPIEVHAFDRDGRAVKSFRREMLLMAMGVSGNRQYGSNKRILPDDDNVCAIWQTSLFRKLTVKTTITTGRHRGLREAELFSADRLDILCTEKILVQMDGEAHALEPRDFPLVMERTEPVLRTIDYA